MFTVPLSLFCILSPSVHLSELKRLDQHDSALDNEPARALVPPVSVCFPGFDTVALPKFISRYWWNDGSISFYTCMIQTHIIHFFGTLNSLIMMTMAVDRSLAICFPLRYKQSLHYFLTEIRLMLLSKNTPFTLSTVCAVTYLATVNYALRSGV